MTIKKNAILFSLLMFFSIVTSCTKDDDSSNTNSCTVTGEGPLVTQMLTLSDFSGINASGFANITINQGALQKVTATGQANIIEAITTEVNSNIWNIGLEGPCGYNYSELSINITIPNINQIESSGSNIIVVDDFNGQTELDLNLNGSSTLTLNGFEGITSLDFSSSGSGLFMANEDISTLNSLSISQSGNFQFSGFNLNVDDCTVETSGSGNTEVTVQNTLDVNISGSAIVRYKGTPTITQNISGVGQLINAN